MRPDQQRLITALLLIWDSILITCQPFSLERQPIRVERQPAGVANLPFIQNFLNPPIHGNNADRSVDDLFPFVHRYSNNMQIEPGDDIIIDAGINLAVEDWGIFDLPIDWRSGKTPIDIGFGWLASPVNPRDVDPVKILNLQNDVDFEKNRDNAPNVPVIDLPRGFKPLNCRPPLCNPFVSSVGVGVDVNTNLNPYAEGGLDFPIPIDPYGSQVRFPLSGGFVSGQPGFNVQYGQQLSPTDALFKNYQKRREVEQLQDFRNWILESQKLTKAQTVPRPRPSLLPDLPEEIPDTPFLPDIPESPFFKSLVRR